MRVPIIPGLTVSDDMFERAEVAITKLNLTPDFLFTWRSFTDPKKWLLIPDPECFGYKAELTLHQTEQSTIKVNIWYGPDLRAGETPKPHNHPWDFTAHVLLGSYNETRYDSSNSGAPLIQDRVHAEGGQNHVPLHVFHEVTEVEPGKTMSLMVCGRGTKGQWGYIDPHTGAFELTAPDPTFRDRLLQLNPQHR
ncbi:MAG: hypothetical protein ACQR33_05795 [Candidatus Saccharibacteria bacterium]